MLFGTEQYQKKCRPATQFQTRTEVDSNPAAYRDYRFDRPIQEHALDACLDLLDIA